MSHLDNYFPTVLILAAACSICSATNFTVIRTNDTGPGSLRAIIIQANSQPGPHLIEFASTGELAKGGSISLGSPLPEITQSLNITVATNAISIANYGFSFAPGTSNLLTRLQIIRGDVLNSGALTMDSCLIQGGSLISSKQLNAVETTVSASPRAGALFSGVTTLTRCVITGNGGDGLVNVGDLVMKDSLVSRNALTGIANAGTASIDGSKVDNNGSDGVFSITKLLIFRSAISENIGAGLQVAGIVQIDGSTLSGNGAGLVSHPFSDLVTNWATDGSRLPISMAVSDLLQSDLPPGTITHYAFPGNVLDSSAAQNHGVNHGAVFVRDVELGRDVLLCDDNPDSWVSGSRIITNVTDSFTISILFKILPGGAGSPFLLFPSQGDSVWGSNSSAGVGIEAHPNSIRVIEHSSGRMPAVIEGRGSFSGWTRVTVVYKDKVPRLYINGFPWATGVASPKIVRPSNGMAGNGGIGGTSFPGGGFKGLIGEFTIINHALSDPEVSSLYNFGLDPTSNIETTISTTNSTISGNRSIGFSVLRGDAALVNCTISNNGTGGVGSSEGNLTLLNTIVALNPNRQTQDVTGRVISLGHNFIGNSAGSSGWNNLTDYLNEDPKIGPLQDNGGSTPSHELLYGSLCINAGTTNGAPDVDQRGVNRPQGNGVDIGAYEGLPIIAPVILGGLTNQTAYIGGSATWSVDVIGTKPLSIRWSSKGSNIPNGTNVVLTLNNLKTSDAGLYTLTITNIVGEVTGSAFLTVIPPGSAPVITNQPTGLSVASGDSATFAVGARGTPPLRYQWQLHGSSLAGKTDSSLVINPVQIANAGNYRVIVSNDYGSVTSSNAVLMVDSLMVKPDEAIAAQGNEILVPVRVKQFSNVGSLQFSMHWNVDVIALQAVEQFRLPGMTGQNFGTTLSSRLTVSWEAQSGTSISLLDESPIFVLRFMVVGGQGSSTLITIDGDPTPIEFLDGQLRPLVPDLRNGSVTVLPTIRLNGNIVYAGSVRPVTNATVAALSTASVTKTLTNGLYELRVPTGSSPAITPNHTNDVPLAAEVTTGDILLIRRHVLNTGPLDSPFKLLAADVNDDGQITTGDILSIRRFILGVTNQMPRGLWRFVPADYTLDPAKPFAAPGFIVRSNQMTDISGLNFIAVKLGDANLSWGARPVGAGLANGNSTQRISKMSTGGLTITVGSGGASSGGTAALPLAVNGFNGISTFQFSIHWDPNHVAFTGADQFGLAGLALGNFGQPAPGTLTVSWEDPTGASSSLATGTSLFTLHFQMLGPGGSSSSVAINGEPTPIEVLNAQLSSVAPRLQPGTVTVSGGGTPVQITSQPVSQTVIEGQPVTFSVAATGTEPRSYQWRKNAQNIPGATGLSFSLAHALTADAGRYTVVVGNGFGPSVESNPADLTVTTATSGKLTFTVGSLTAAPGASTVVPVMVSRFVDISTVQFSLHWNTNQLAFEGLEQFGLTALAIGNFGQPAPGVLTMSWEDPSGGSSSLPDRTVIFAIRFKTLALAGSSASISIDGNPTPIEVLNRQISAVVVAAVPGTVTVQGAAGVDSDGDGLMDDEERRLGTDPSLADTDGDGYSDGVEVQLGTNPKSSDSKPEALTVFPAVELEMVTLTSRQYQLENSTDLKIWVPVGSAFAGTGAVTNKLISVKGNKTVFWRLRALP